MACVSVLHMNGGNGRSSYANNSHLQKKIMLKARPFLEDSIRDAFSSSGIIPICVKIADLGCSSGPNTLSAISGIINTIHGLMTSATGMNSPPPEFQVFLNDLPGNDFNNIFTSLHDFHEELKESGVGGHCFIAGVPGSFYTRIFPSSSIDFFHSSCSLHWLSQVPVGVEKNEGHIHIAKGSPPAVIEAYTTQFKRDFSLFLRLRSEEIKPGGRMVITLSGRSREDPSIGESCGLWELLAKCLADMLAEGLIEEDDLSSFQVPIYYPWEGEIRAITQEEGSFSLDKLESFEVGWDLFDEKDKHRGAHHVANCIRSVTEPILTTHFGGTLMIENLFERYADRVARYLLSEKGKHFITIFSLTKKLI